MRVALINNTFALKGGTERHILDASELLKAAGIDTVFIAETEEDAPVKPYLVPDLFKYRPWQKRKLQRALSYLESLLLETHVDMIHLVHMHHAEVTRFLTARWPTVRTIHTPYMFCVAGTRYLPHTKRVCTQRCGIQCLATDHVEGCIRYDRNHRYPFKDKIKKLWETFANHEADAQLHRIGVASQFMKDLLVQHYYDVDRIDIIHPPLSEAMEAVEPAPFPLNSQPTLIFAGRLIPEKGCFDLLQILLKMKTPARLLIVGEGSERALLEQDAKTLGLSDRIEFRGWLTPEETWQVYGDAWINLFPSHWPEPFGFTGIEGFLNHRPTVAYDVGGVREWLVPGENGILIAPGDVTTMAEAIDMLLANPSRAEAMGIWGRQYALERFGRQHHLAAKIRFYEAAIDAFTHQNTTIPETAGAHLP